MKYIRFKINKYKAIKESKITIKNEPIPIIGLNESGKSSTLEAIASFDYRNDQIANERKWSFTNRYIPQEKEFSVEVEISFSGEEMTKLLNTFPEAEKTALNGMGLVETLETLTIIRVFKNVGKSTKNYSILNQEGELINKFCQQLLLMLPRILYFDTFLDDQFPNTIVIPPAYIANPSSPIGVHATIIARMFELAGFNLREFLQQADRSSRETILSEVNSYITEQIINDWVEMHLSKGDIDAEISPSTLIIRLQQNQATTTNIDINIIETFIDKNGKSHEASLPLSDRSLGFRWFFNFSARKCFGNNGEDKFVYLFDEPGSYLQESAQIVLLKAIKEFARDQYVIYSTHSDDLLNAGIININNIKISDKREREIRLISFSEVKTKRLEGALAPLYKALRAKINLNSTLNRLVIVTEGITDFYFWNMITIDKNIVYLPGFGASQNEYLISIAIGTSKKYVAIFDGDGDGDKAIERYTKFFGEKEKERWYQYKNKAGGNIYLEAIFSSTDKKRLLEITSVADPKKALTSLHFSTDEVKNKYWSQIDAETKANIDYNITQIKTMLSI